MANEKETKKTTAPKQEEFFSNIKLLKDALLEIKNLTPEQLDFLHKTIAPGLENPELALFLYRCKISGLDPLNNEAYAYIQITDGKRQLVVITARDAKRKVAAKTGQLGAVQVEAIYNKESDSVKGAMVRCETWEGGKLWGAEAKIWRKDCGNKPFIVTVPLSEYARKSRSGQTIGIWAFKPETMIKKVAESQALSAAFPELLSGIYDEAERFDATPEVVEAEIPADPADNTPATEGQKQILKTLRVEFNGETLTQGEAKQMIAEGAKKPKNGQS